MAKQQWNTHADAGNAGHLPTQMQAADPGLTRRDKVDSRITMLHYMTLLTPLNVFGSHEASTGK